MEIPSQYRRLAEAIEAGDIDSGVAEAIRVNSEGYGAVEIFEQAVVPCLQSVGDRFSRLEIFLPEMMRSADVVKEIHKVLADTLEGHVKIESAGRVVIGTVFGDIHDLGKNIVASMLEVNGFEVHDLGVDVSAQEFLKRARELDADIIAMSSLMNNSIPYMADVIELVRGNEADRARFRILVGGGPVTAGKAEEIGADAYGENAADAVKEALTLLGKRA